jgi:phage terminase Nu1 subunit (DNA packaging protein)
VKFGKQRTEVLHGPQPSTRAASEDGQAENVLGPTGPDTLPAGRAAARHITRCKGKIPSYIEEAEEVAMLFVRKAEFARLRGVSRAALTTWQQKGFLVLSADGRVDVEASNALLDARPSVHNGGQCSPPSWQAWKAASGPKGAGAGTIAPGLSEPTAAAPDWTTAEAIRRKESSNALLKQLEYDQKSGRLLAADEVAATWRGHITDARKRLLTVPSRVGARIAHLSRTEIETIDREIRDALADLVGGPA